MAITKRMFIRVLGGGVVLAAGAAAALSRVDGMPAVAVEGWQGPPSTERDPRRRALSWAILAPNPHNRQPWLVDLRQPDTIVLRVDRTRLLPHTDPFGRQILVGHGTFLELLAIAAASEGFRAEIAPFPEGEFPEDRIDDRPVATVRLVREPGLAPDALFPQIARRRSTKTAFDTARRPEPAHLAALAAERRDPTLRFAATADPAAVDALRAIARRAMEIEISTPRTLRESVELTRVGAAEIAKHRDGIKLHGPMIWLARNLGMLSLDDAMTPGTQAYEAGRRYALAGFDSAMGFGWLASAGNSRAAQLAAGRAYARLDLKAAEIGLAIHPLSQSLQEFPEVVEQRRAIHKAAGTPDGATLQMLFRLGYAAPPGPTPRRPLDSMTVA